MCLCGSNKMHIAPLQRPVPMFSVIVSQAVMPFFYGLVVLAITVFTSTIPVSATNPTVDCNHPYVLEGQSLECVCAAPPSSVGASVSWPGHSNTSSLTVDNVRRVDNGTVFACLVTQQGVVTGSTSVTLRVAFGPASNSTTITSQPEVVTNSTTSVTLTCHVKDAYPSVTYSWSGLCSGDAVSCTFTPLPEDEGRMTYCTVMNSVSNNTPGGDLGLAKYQLRFVENNMQEENGLSEESTGPNYAGRTEWQGQLTFLCFMLTITCFQH